MNPAIVWRFQDAPKHLQVLSQNGGDEDWLVEVPREMFYDGTPNWIERMDCDTPQQYEHPTKPGWYVCIGAHA